MFGSIFDVSRKTWLCISCFCLSGQSQSPAKQSTATENNISTPTSSKSINNGSSDVIMKVVVSDDVMDQDAYSSTVEHKTGQYKAEPSHNPISNISSLSTNSIMSLKQG